MGYIYILTSPSGKSYIGQTTRPIEKRLEEHRTGKNDRCRLIYRAINKYGWGNFDKDWYECPDGDLNKHEELMVEVLGTLVPGGYNLKEGGGNSKMSEETKQKMSEAKKNMSKETRQKMSEAHLEIPMSKETRLKMSNSKKGEGNHASKRVYQYGLEGNLLGSFASSGEAKRHLDEKSDTNIRRCVRGEQNTAYGFKWSYNNAL
jgi:group I intron endonuclease